MTTAQKDTKKDSPPQILKSLPFTDLILWGDSSSVLQKIPDNSIPLILTSPPYDQIRGNSDYSDIFNFEKIAKEAARVLTDGGTLLWNVNDSTINGSKTGTSFRQALYFKDECGLTYHDLLFFKKNSFSFPASKDRYHNVTEFVFVFSKGRPSTFNALMDRPNKYLGVRGASGRGKDGKRNKGISKVVNKMGKRFNVWEYIIGGGHTTKDKIDFPALMHEGLARDLILSYSNEGDLVLDMFAGGGTTGIMAHLNKRHFLLVDKSENYCKMIQDRFKQRFKIEVKIQNENNSISTTK